MLDPSVWKENRQFISVKGDKHLEILYASLDGLLERVDRQVSLDEFKATVAGSGAFEREKDREVLLQMFKVLEEADIGNDILHDLLVQIKQRDIAEKLAIVSFDFAEGKKSLKDIKDIYDSFETVETEIEEAQFVTDDLEELYQQTVASPGLRWRLQSLNRMLGSIRKGDFGFVFARPETGKTTFLASEVSYFAEQSEAPIIWINNEQMGTLVMSRLYQASLGITTQQLMSNRTESQRLFFNRTHGNIKLHDDATVHKRKIESLCAKYAEYTPLCAARPE